MKMKKRQQYENTKTLAQKSGLKVDGCGKNPNKFVFPGLLN